MVSADRHFEPRQAGQLHLRSQPQQRSPRDGFYPPEIQRVADEQVARITPSAAEPDTAGEPVEQPAYCPCGGEGIPPGLTADALDNPPQCRRRSADNTDACVYV
jgi:hypothetical protein